jgi:hypothetical protein
VVVAIAVSCDIDMRMYIYIYITMRVCRLPYHRFAPPGARLWRRVPNPGDEGAQLRGVGHKGLPHSFRFLFPRGYTQRSPSRG